MITQHDDQQVCGGPQNLVQCVDGDNQPVLARLKYLMQHITSYSIFL